MKSRYEAVLRSAAALRCGAQFRVEVKELASTYGPVDVHIPEPYDILIQMDGEHHFDAEPYETHLHTYAKLRDVDMRFNAESWNQGRRLLRIHYKDAKYCGRLIEVAMALCHYYSRFIMHSFSFGEGLKAE